MNWSYQGDTAQPEKKDWSYKGGQGDWSYQGNKPLNNSNSVTAAQSDIGDQNYNNLCQKFVEQETLGHTGVYGSAIKAYEDQAGKGNVSSDYGSLQPGDILFFEDKNQPDGHTALYAGNGKMVSAESADGVQQRNLSDWIRSTGQTPLGFSRGYK